MQAREQLWLGLLCAISACDTGDTKSAPPVQSRVEAVAAKAPAADPLLDFCDVRAESGQGKALTFPALEGVSSALPDASLTWINLWATWCKPCIEEMPMLVGWHKRLSADGKRVALRFISVDDSAETVSAFRAQHTSVPASERITDPSSLAPFISQVGLDSGAGLPIHIFVDQDARVRCVRSGAVTEAHYPVVASLLR